MIIKINNKMTELYMSIHDSIQLKKIIVLNVYFRNMEDLTKSSFRDVRNMDVVNGHLCVVEIV